MMKDIKGYEGLYAITDDGRVWSYRTNRFMKPCDNGNGYLFVSLWLDGKKKKFKIHRLVGEAFLPPPAPGETDIGHKDDCRWNNCVDNLQWMTRAENLDTPNFRQLNKHKQWTKIRCVETGEVFKSQAEAGREKNIHPYGINRVLFGKQKTAGGYHWERYCEEEV